MHIQLVVERCCALTEQRVRSPLAAVKHKQSGTVDNNESLAAPARRSLQSTYVGLGVGSTEAIQSKIGRKESTSTDSGFEDAVDFPTPHSYDDLSATVRQLCDLVESDGKTVGALRCIKVPSLKMQLIVFNFCRCLSRANHFSMVQCRSACTHTYQQHLCAYALL